MYLVLLIFSLVSTTVSLGAVTLDYGVIESTGKFCPGRDSCTRPAGRSPGILSADESLNEVDWKRRNCFCDDACAVYGDCCVDAPAFEPKEQRHNYKRFRCINFKQYGDVYVAHGCPDNYRGPESVRNSCENPDKVSDPFGSMPVTNLASGITYRSYYCAVCNGDVAGDDDAPALQFWRPRLSCPGLTGYSKRFRNITKDFVAERLEFDPEKPRWGVRLDVGGIEVYHECVIDPAMPEGLDEKSVRACSGKNTVSDCPDDYAGDESTRELCGSYTALVFEPNAAYRNVHCAICNNATLSRLICLNLGPFGRFNWHMNFDAFSFAVLFNLNGDDRELVGFKRRCPIGELFDPFSKTCRNVICGDEKQIYSHGRCYDIATTIASTTTAAATTAISTTTLTTTTTTTTITTTITTTTTATTTTATTITTATTSFITTTSPTSDTTIAAENTASPVVIDILDRFEVTTVLVQEISWTNSTADAETEEGTGEKEDSKELSTAVSPEFHGCPKFALSPTEFIMLEDGAGVFVEAHGRTYQEFDIRESDGSLLICVNVDTGELDRDTQFVGKYGTGLGFFTVVCLTFSSLCCVLHIGATLLAPELRKNLSGNNLLSLTLALLGGYISFIIAMFAKPEEKEDTLDVSCLALAAFIHYFFTASFCWMLVISADVWRTLRRATTKLRLAAGVHWGRFATMSVVAWGVPAALTALSVLADLNALQMPEGLRPGFADGGLCWFSRRSALAVFFVAPFLATVCVNFCLFMASACLVWTAARTNRAAISSKNNSNAKGTNGFRLYLRLALLMGLTWVVGLAAAVTDSPPVQYVFMALNATQGTYIFAVFTCSQPKVVDSVRERLREWSLLRRGRFQPEDPSWRWTNSTKRSNLDSPPPSPIDAEEAEGKNVLKDASAKKMAGNRTAAVMDLRGKTVYTVSSQQANSLTQNSFDGRYF